MSFSEGWFTPLILCMCLQRKEAETQWSKKGKVQWAHKALQRCYSAPPLLCKVQPIKNLLLPPTYLNEIHIIERPQQAKGSQESCSRTKMFLSTGHKCLLNHMGVVGVEAPLLCSFLGVPFLLTDVGELLGHYVSNVMHCLAALKSIQKDAIFHILSFY